MKYIQNKLLTNQNSVYLLPVKRIIPWSVTLNFESLYPQPFHFNTSDLRKLTYLKFKNKSWQVCTTTRTVYFTLSCYVYRLWCLLIYYIPVFWYDTLNLSAVQRRRGDFKSFIGFLFIHGEVSMFAI